MEELLVEEVKADWKEGIEGSVDCMGVVNGTRYRSFKALKERVRRIITDAELEDSRSPEPEIICPSERPPNFPLFCGVAIYIFYLRLKSCDIVDGIFVDVAPHPLATSNTDVVGCAKELTGGEGSEQFKARSVRRWEEALEMCRK